MPVLRVFTGETLGIRMKALQLGRYHLLDRIAFGGMAEIYRAKTFDDQGRVHMVAVKRILSHLGRDDDFIRMLVDEARIASLMQHENIAKTYEFCHVQGEYFIVMEYVDGKDGRTLLDRCRALRRWIPPELCAFIMMHTLRALHCAHQQTDRNGRPLQLIHRDVSPSNVICSYSGEVKLCDFGIAKATLSRVQTRSGVIKGKVKYMSPEQAMGRRLDPRSDIFSAGSVLYEFLTKVPPFLAPNEMELLVLVRETRYRPVRERNPMVPPVLEAIVDTAMSRSLEERYQSAAEFADALDEYLRVHAARITRSHLGQFIRLLFEDDIERELRALEEYVVEDHGIEETGVNLIAEDLPPGAALSRLATSSLTRDNTGDMTPQEMERGEIEVAKRMLPQNDPSLAGSPTVILDSSDLIAAEGSTGTLPIEPSSEILWSRETQTLPTRAPDAVPHVRGDIGDHPTRGYPPQGQPSHRHPPQGQPPQGQPSHRHPPHRYPPQGQPPQEHPPQGQPLGGQHHMGHPPGGYPSQGYPSQGHPPQGQHHMGHPPQEYPPQGHPPQGYPPQGYPPQGYPPQGRPPQGYPPQGYPPQGYPPQGRPPQGYQPQGRPPQGYPPQGQAPQGVPPQGQAPQGVPPPAQPHQGQPPANHAWPHAMAGSMSPHEKGEQPAPGAPPSRPAGYAYGAIDPHLAAAVLAQEGLHDAMTVILDLDEQDEGAASARHPRREMDGQPSTSMVSSPARPESGFQRAHTLSGTGPTRLPEHPPRTSPSLHDMATGEIEETSRTPASPAPQGDQLTQELEAGDLEDQAETESPTYPPKHAKADILSVLEAPSQGGTSELEVSDLVDIAASQKRAADTDVGMSPAQNTTSRRASPARQGSTKTPSGVTTELDMADLREVLSPEAREPRAGGTEELDMGELDELDADELDELGEEE